MVIKLYVFKGENATARHGSQMSVWTKNDAVGKNFQSLNSAASSSSI